jgi:hypothetical protein
MASNEKAMELHDHQRIDVRIWCPDCGEELRHETLNKADLQAQEALEAQQVTELPERDAMSIVGFPTFPTPGG